MPEDDPQVKDPLERFIIKKGLLLEQWRQQFGHESGWSVKRLSKFVTAAKANATEEERTAWNEHIKGEVNKVQGAARARAFNELHSN
jgi:hypothetical protein